MAGGQRRVEKPCAAAASDGDQPVDPVLVGNDRVERRRRAVVGRVEQVGAVEMQEVEEEHRQRLVPGCGDVGRRPNRDAVTWKRCGRPSGRSAIASPSATRSVTGRASVASTTSGSRAVTSSRLRV